MQPARKRRSVRRFRRLAATLAAAALAIAGHSQSAEAIIINDTLGTAGSLSLGAPYLGVVNITQGGSQWCTGSLIDATHILTAQHCTTGEAAASFTINFVNSDGITVSPGNTRSVTGKAEMPGYIDADFLAGLDVAILTMSTAAPDGFAALSLGVADPTGSLATTVGFGLQGIGSIGYQGNYYNDYANWLTYNYSYGTRWAAENVIDYFGNALSQTATSYSGTANILNSDFDGPLNQNPLGGIGSSATALANEGTTCFGDSGGPLLVSGMIVGVLSGGVSPLNVCEEPDVSWWTGTFATNSRSFIAANSNAVFVPEPSTFVLLALGIGGLGLRGGRRRHRSRA